MLAFLSTAALSLTAKDYSMRCEWQFIERETATNFAVKLTDYGYGRKRRFQSGPRGVRPISRTRHGGDQVPCAFDLIERQP